MLIKIVLFSLLILWLTFFEQVSNSESCTYFPNFPNDSSFIVIECPEKCCSKPNDFSTSTKSLCCQKPKIEDEHNLSNLEKIAVRLTLGLGIPIFCFVGLAALGCCIRNYSLKKVRRNSSNRDYEITSIQSVEILNANNLVPNSFYNLNDLPPAYDNVVKNRV